MLDILASWNTDILLSKIPDHVMLWPIHPSFDVGSPRMIIIGCFVE
jgi:hypothetical protein